jgi:hypothetical protein
MSSPTEWLMVRSCNERPNSWTWISLDAVAFAYTGAVRCRIKSTSPFSYRGALTTQLR